MQDKKELRRHFSALRKKAKTLLKDMTITKSVLSISELSDADTVLLFASFGSEPNTWELANELMKNGKTVAFPRCKDEGVMTFHVVNDLSLLRDGDVGRYGICEPDGSLPCPDITERTVCIVPGLAFTEDGGRLGYGGGYYDRFLAEYPDICTIALAYEAVITDSLPLSEHDVKINQIVTEERTVLCNE
ncbi:MAG: 5-formyltetrahydrofolate cyclo-ligase [Ruminococcus sp.]|nr:5-formyltetrahydrofolate cyclo-ligase [Ruminococcus sp.]